MLGVAGASNPDDIVIPTASDKLRYEISLDDAPRALTLAEALDANSARESDGRAIVMFEDYEKAVEYRDLSAALDSMKRLVPEYNPENGQ